MEKHLLKVLACLAFLLLAGCTTIDGRGNSHPKNTPTNNVSTADGVLACQAEVIAARQLPRDDTILLYIVGFEDGTQSSRFSVPGKLSQGTGRSAIDAIIRHFGNKHVKTVSRPHAEVVQLYSNGIDISDEMIGALKRRHGVGRLMILEGAFIGFGDPAGLSGSGGSGSVNDSNMRFSFGASSRTENRTIIFSAQLSEVGGVTKTLGSIELSMTITNESVTVEIVLGFDRVGVNLQGPKRVVDENIHTAQMTLSRAAVAGAMGVVFGQSARACISGEKASAVRIAEGMRRFRSLSMHERKKEIQRELATRGLYDGQIDGMLGAKTKRALTSFHQSSETWPTNVNTTTGLIDVYALLISRTHRTAVPGSGG